MGVYVFACVHGPYVKVGHHLVTRGRPNAFYRVATSGFERVIHPPELDGRLYLSDLTLVAWYPTLDRACERDVHRAFREGSVGEFHRAQDLPAILEDLDARSPRRTVTSRARAAAVRWGRRQIRRAQRRKARRLPK